MSPPVLRSGQRVESIWICPPVAPLEQQESNTVELLYSSIAMVEARPAGPPGVAGLELRVALMLLQGDEGLPLADNDFWRAKCSSLFLRPAVEPIACSYWKRLSSFELDDAAALSVASALAGRPLVYRKGPATGRSVKGDVGFEPLPRARQWLADIRAAAADPALQPALPAYCFARTIIAHPLFRRQRPLRPADGPRRAGAGSGAGSAGGRACARLLPSRPRARRGADRAQRKWRMVSVQRPVPLHSGRRPRAHRRVAAPERLTRI